MSKEKYTLDFVNDGEPFELTPWTVEKHEKALAHLLKDHKDKDVQTQDSLLRAYIIYQALVEIDSEVDIQEIINMHPENQIELFNAVYLEGKKDIHFHKKSSKKKKNAK